MERLVRPDRQRAPGSGPGPTARDPGAGAQTNQPEPQPSSQANKEGFLSQPQHVYITGTGYNAVPAGEQRSPACGCGAKHGADYRPGPHATWDCPFRYIARYGSCPGFLPSGWRDPAQWNGDSLTVRARQA